MPITVVKTYGVVEGWHRRHGKRWFIVADGRQSVDLHYAKQAVALEKAEAFVRSCYRDFTDFQGQPIHFEFEQVG